MSGKVRRAITLDRTIYRSNFEIHFDRSAFFDVSNTLEDGKDIPNRLSPREEQISGSSSRGNEETTYVVGRFQGAGKENRDAADEHNSTTAMQKALILFTLMFSLILALSSCDSQENEPKAEQSTESPVEAQLTWEQIDSLNEAEQKMLIWRYDAVFLQDTNFKFTHTYQYQTLCDTSAFIALRGSVQDIVWHDEQMILLSSGDYGRGDFYANLSIPSELFKVRGFEFDNESSREGCFIVRIRKSKVSIVSDLDAEVTDHSILESGELEYARAEVIYGDDPTLFLYGELIDFNLNQEQ